MANAVNGDDDSNSQDQFFDPRQPLVSSDIFDMFVVTVDDAREMNGHNMSAEGSVDGSIRQSMGRR